MNTPVGDGTALPPPLDEVCRNATDLLRAIESPLRRLTVRAGDTVVEMEWPVPTAPPSLAAPPVVADDGAQRQPGVHLITAPHVGTFYRCPEPGAEPFVVEGGTVRRGQQVGILEAMKLMNPIEADRDGRVVEILVADGVAVEFDQPLIALSVAEEASECGDH